MTTIKIKEKFPCGYELEIEMKSLFMDGWVDHKNKEGCPLHGKKCKNHNKGGKI